ncbi:MAG: nucleotidyltransferase family protein [Anaerolineaceae bacterium]|nr:MAG: nucleotidyltransferase family protein [Anaerolineaceae bacterium]
MITAIILAAGQSKRMGQPKMLLPWGETNVLGQVIETMRRAGVENILVVTGGAREQVEEIVRQYAVSSTQNAECERGEMLSSVQAGLRILRGNPSAGAALIVLGDQPQVEERSVRAVVEAFEGGQSNLVVPSYQMRRGHPWLVARPLWDEILQMESPQSPRDFLNQHAGEISYVEVDTPSILADLDTFEDYLKSRP